MIRLKNMIGNQIGQAAVNCKPIMKKNIFSISRNDFPSLSIKSFQRIYTTLYEYP